MIASVPSLVGKIGVLAGRTAVCGHAAARYHRISNSLRIPLLRTTTTMTMTMGTTISKHAFCFSTINSKCLSPKQQQQQQQQQQHLCFSSSSTSPSSSSSSSSSSGAEDPASLIDPDDLLAAPHLGIPKEILQKSEELYKQDVTKMTDEELMRTSDIPGWNLVTSKPRTLPPGAKVGTVVSTKMQKTINVAVNKYRVVPKYEVRVRYTKKFMAHDEFEIANEGDVVLIEPCHKMSKRKHYMLREIIRAKGQV